MIPRMNITLSPLTGLITYWTLGLTVRGLDISTTPKSRGGHRATPQSTPDKWNRLVDSTELIGLRVMQVNSEISKLRKEQTRLG